MKFYKRNLPERYFTHARAPPPHPSIVGPVHTSGTVKTRVSSILMKCLIVGGDNEFGRSRAWRGSGENEWPFSPFSHTDAYTAY